MLTPLETIIVNSIKKNYELRLPMTIGGVKLSGEEVLTLIGLLEPKVVTSHIVHSIDISNVQELLQTIEEFNANHRNTDSR